ncbi:MAG: hypothetical protein EP330_10090 [Deltaproteobacteria bacterium]|nr:MAG: hypothetical protein EP330_10090 [Deltaproteobacteria bacterium]
MRSLTTLSLLVLAVGCKTSANIAEDTGVTTDTGVTSDTDVPGPENGAGDTVLPENTGSGVGSYQVVARAEGTDTTVGNQRFFETDLRVDLFDDQGARISGAEVSMSTLAFGNVALIEDSQNPGRYEGAAFGYDRSYNLVIDGPDGRFEATAVGPGIHAINPGPVPVDAAEDWVIRWDPTGATFCEIDTRGMGNQMTDDDGEFTVPAGDIDQEVGEVGEERARITRWEELALTGALPGSTFRVSIEVTKNDIDTFDSRVGNLDGTVGHDGDLGNLAGTVYVLAWPADLDAQGPPFFVATIGDYPTTTTFEINGLEPGDWFFRAYLDADASDAGLATPAGPTNGDPFDEWDVGVDPNQTVSHTFFFQDIW